MSGIWSAMLQVHEWDDALTYWEMEEGEGDVSA
jgi:hypothetical protein